MGPAPCNGQRNRVRHLLHCSRCGVALSLLLLLPNDQQLLRAGVKGFQRQATDALENHHGVDAGQRVDFGGQRAFFACRGVLPAPIIDCFFKLGQRNIHRRIVRLTWLITSRRFALRNLRKFTKMRVIGSDFVSAC